MPNPPTLPYTTFSLMGHTPAVYILLTHVCTTCVHVFIHVHICTHLHMHMYLHIYMYIYIPITHLYKFL